MWDRRARLLPPCIPTRTVNGEYGAVVPCRLPPPEVLRRKKERPRPREHRAICGAVSFHIHLRGFFSSITAHVAAAVIPPSATSGKTSSGVPIGVIRRE